MKAKAIGLDDGYFGTKVFNGRDKWVIKSRARRGKSTTASFYDTNAGTPSEYEADGIIYSVGDVLESSIITFDDYPISPINRVIIQHGLQVAGLAGEKLKVCSGLPMRQFYLANGKKNTSLINDKIGNCLKSVKPLKSSTAIIEHADVLPEGFALMFDLMFTEDYNSVAEGEEPKVIVDESVWSKDQGFVDIGGSTVDIGVISNGQIDVSNTSSLKFGVHKAYELIKNDVCTMVGLDDVNINVIDKIIANPRHIEGFDFTRNIENSYRMVVEEIFAEISKCIGKEGALLSSLNFLGGGTELFQNYFPQNKMKKTIVKDPVIGNARGFYMYAKYIA
jgi:plasmid segregation protein ParM